MFRSYSEAPSTIPTPSDRLAKKPVTQRSGVFRFIVLLRVDSSFEPAFTGFDWKSLNRTSSSVIDVRIVAARATALPSSLGFRVSFVIGNWSFVIHNAAPPSDEPALHAAQAASTRIARPQTGAQGRRRTSVDPWRSRR